VSIPDDLNDGAEDEEGEDYATLKQSLQRLSEANAGLAFCHPSALD